MLLSLCRPHVGICDDSSADISASDIRSTMAMKLLHHNDESLDLVVMGRDPQFEGGGFKSLHRILDGHFNINLLLNLY